jgi:hypothetical protein
MSFSDHETQRDASIVAVLCHFLFVSSVYIHTKTASFARLLSIERRRTSGRLSLASLRFILIEYKKKRTRKYLIYTEIGEVRGREREAKRKSVQCLSFSSSFVHLRSSDYCSMLNEQAERMKICHNR